MSSFKGHADEYNSELFLIRPLEYKKETFVYSIADFIRQKTNEVSQLKRTYMETIMHLSQYKSAKNKMKLLRIQ